MTDEADRADEHSGPNGDLERALERMAAFDAQDAAIGRAEAEGAEVEMPELTDAKMESIIAASLRAAKGPTREHPPAAANASSGYRRLLVWGGAAVAAAASVLLWRASVTPTGEPSVPGLHASPLPAARLQLGGSARTLGDAPQVRPYGPGDTFVLQVAFEVAPAVVPFVEVFAEDAAGAARPLPFPARTEGASVLFEGEIAKHLPPGLWTLRVRVGHPLACSATRAQACETLDTRIEVLGP